MFIERTIMQCVEADAIRGANPQIHVLRPTHDVASDKKLWLIDPGYGASTVIGCENGTPEEVLIAASLCRVLNIDAFAQF